MALSVVSFCLPLCSRGCDRSAPPAHGIARRLGTPRAVPAAWVAALVAQRLGQRPPPRRRHPGAPPAGTLQRDSSWIR